MPPLRLLAFLCLAALLLAGPAKLRAQELREEVTPFSVWLDFRALASPHPPHIALPIWLESLQIQTTAPKESIPGATVFRLRFRRLGALNGELQLRLFFDDQKDTAPRVTAWSE